MAIITDYQKCNCGAITLYFDNGASTSMYQDTFDKMDIDLSEANEIQMSYCCDHCVNHWRIDLCECGSGERVDECGCSSHRAMQRYGERLDTFSMIMSNFQMIMQ